MSEDLEDFLDDMVYQIDKDSKREEINFEMDQTLKDLGISDLASKPVIGKISKIDKLEDKLSKEKGLAQFEERDFNSTMPNQEAAQELMKQQGTQNLMRLYREGKLDTATIQSGAIEQGTVDNLNNLLASLGSKKKILTAPPSQIKTSGKDLGLSSTNQQEMDNILNSMNGLLSERGAKPYQPSYEKFTPQTTNLTPINSTSNNTNDLLSSPFLDSNTLSLLQGLSNTKPSNTQTSSNFSNTQTSSNSSNSQTTNSKFSNMQTSNSHSLSGPVECGGCGGKVPAAVALKAGKHYWHQECLVCSFCMTQLSPEYNFEADNKLFCKRCYDEFGALFNGD